MGDFNSRVGKAGHLEEVVRQLRRKIAYNEKNGNRMVEFLEGLTLDDP